MSQYVLFILQLLLVTGSHCLTDTIALVEITGNNVCSIVFAVVSSTILQILEIPPSFIEGAIR